MKEWGNVDRFVAGAIGPPGQRAFYIRVGAGGEDEWYLLEKTQVQALAQRCMELLRADALPEAVPLGDLGEPTESFRVGEILVAVDADGFTFALLPTEEGETGVRFTADPSQVRAMAEEALAVVVAGRPLCPFCNLPKDPDGHLCPATNGDLRA